MQPTNPSRRDFFLKSAALGASTMLAGAAEPKKPQANGPYPTKGLAVYAERQAPRPMNFERRALGPKDVAIKIHYCGRVSLRQCRGRRQQGTTRRFAFRGVAPHYRNEPFECLLLHKHELPWLVKQGNAIVNTSSTAGVKGFPQQASYCAAKFGVNGLSKVASIDDAQSNVRVNVIAPGLNETKMMERLNAGPEKAADGFLKQIPLGRAGRPEEVAAMFTWLCLEAGSYTTGSTFVLDGGLTV